MEQNNIAAITITIYILGGIILGATWPSDDSPGFRVGILFLCILFTPICLLVRLIGPHCSEIDENSSE